MRTFFNDKSNILKRVWFPFVTCVTTENSGTWSTSRGNVYFDSYVLGPSWDVVPSDSEMTVFASKKLLQCERDWVQPLSGIYHWQIYRCIMRTARTVRRQINISNMVLRLTKTLMMMGRRRSRILKRNPGWTFSWVGNVQDSISMIEYDHLCFPSSNFTEDNFGALVLFCWSWNWAATGTGLYMAGPFTPRWGVSKWKLLTGGDAAVLRYWDDIVSDGMRIPCFQEERKLSRLLDDGVVWDSVLEATRWIKESNDNNEDWLLVFWVIRGACWTVIWGLGGMLLTTGTWGYLRCPSRTNVL